MSACASCGGALDPTDSRSILRVGTESYHLACAPLEVVDQAAEEYRAILRKGVRYFVEKYSGPVPPTADVGAQFLSLGRSVEEERERRAGT
jgi:hypothetical protein